MRYHGRMGEVMFLCKSHRKLGSMILIWSNLDLFHKYDFILVRMLYVNKHAIIQKYSETEVRVSAEHSPSEVTGYFMYI